MMIRLFFVALGLLGTVVIYAAKLHLTELYEVGQGNVALTTSLPSPLAGEGMGVRGKITHQYIYSSYGTQRNLYHPFCLNASEEVERGLLNQTRRPLNIIHNQFGYTGQSADPSTGLMMLGAFRNYAPGIGRFIQPDTYNSFSKQHVNNPMMYVNGNPIRATDPTGHVFFIFPASPMLNDFVQILLLSGMPEEGVADEVLGAIVRIPQKYVTENEDIFTSDTFWGPFAGRMDEATFEATLARVKESLNTPSFEGVEITGKKRFSALQTEDGAFVSRGTEPSAKTSAWSSNYAKSDAGEALYSLPKEKLNALNMQGEKLENIADTSLKKNPSGLVHLTRFKGARQALGRAVEQAQEKSTLLGALSRYQAETDRFSRVSKQFASDDAKDRIDTTTQQMQDCFCDLSSWLDAI